MEPRLQPRMTKSLSAKRKGGRGFGVFRAAVLAGCLLLIHLTVAPLAWAGANFDLQQSGGIPLTQVGNNYQSTFGTVDALGINTGAVGMVALPQANGTLYYTPYGLFVHGGLPAGHRGWVTAYVSTNFIHTNAVVMYSCPSNLTCNGFGQYAAMSTNAGAQTTVVPQPGTPKNTTVAAGIAIWIPDNNGATAYSGTDNATVSFSMFDFDNGNALIETLQWQFNLAPAGVTIQSGVRLTLSNGTAATAHCNITPSGGTPDYTLSFGNVDGLGINTPTCGTLFAPATPGVSNAIYWTDYNLSATYTDQNPIGGTTITARVSTNFATANVFVVRDAANSSTVPTTAAQFTPLSTGAADTIATGVGSRTTLTRFLGIAVTPGNGAGLTGAQTATVTFQLTVQ